MTSNTFLDDITSIDVLLRNCCKGVYGSSLVEMAKLMKVKYDKYFGSIEKCNMLTLVSSMLDPTRKREYMEVLLVDVYGETGCTSMCDMIEESLYELYDDFVRSHAPPKTTSMSEPSDSSTSMNKRTTHVEPSVMLKDKVNISRFFSIFYILICLT